MRKSNGTDGSYKDFSLCLGNYFSRYLSVERGLSPHTIASYSKTFTLLLTFISKVMKVNINTVSFADMNKETILKFLEWLENERKCSVRSRN